MREALLTGRITCVMDFSRTAAATVNVTIDAIINAVTELCRIYDVMYGPDNFLAFALRQLSTGDILRRWLRETTVIFSLSPPNHNITAADIVLARLNEAFISWQNDTFDLLLPHFNIASATRAPTRAGEALGRIPYGQAAPSALSAYINSSSSAAIFPTLLAHAVSSSSAGPPHHGHASAGRVALMDEPSTTGALHASAKVITSATRNLGMGTALPDDIMALTRAAPSVTHAAISKSAIKTARTDGKQWCFYPFTQSGPCTTCLPYDSRHHQDIKATVVRAVLRH